MMSAPVGSISFICNACFKGWSHAHSTIHAGGVFSVDATQFWGLFNNRITNAMFEDDDNAVFNAMGLGSPICRYHWMNDVKTALEAHRRSPTMPFEERMKKKGITFFHAFWMHQLKADAGFMADAPFTIAEVEEVAQ